VTPAEFWGDQFTNYQIALINAGKSQTDAVHIRRAVEARLLRENPGAKIGYPQLRAEILAELKRQGEQKSDLELIPYKREEPLRAFDKVLDVIKRHGAAVGVMAFGGKFVRPTLKDRPGIRADVQSMELAPHSESTLATALNEAVQFIRQGKKELKTDCPDKIARALLGSAALAPEAEIRGISETPILKGGELRTARGFDAQLRVWINCPDVKLPEVIDREAAMAALERLKNDWLGEFSFVSELDRSVALAGLLTAAMRASLPGAPGFMVAKPSYGAGGSTLCELIHIVLTGRDAAVINATRDSEELVKQIDGVQLAGRACVFIDNITEGSEFRSVALGLLLTQPSRELRPLGRSTMIEVPCTQMVLANGVNPRLAADLSRRFVLCDLDPNVENPEQKIYKRPALIEDAKRERVSMLADLYTIVLAYLKSGVREKGQALAGFADWARHVQEPLMWLGEPDPVLSRAKIVSEDPVKAILVRLFRSWHALFGAAPILAAEVIDKATGFSDMTSPSDSASKELCEVLDEVARDKSGKLSAKTFGYYLRGKKNRIAGGLRLEPRGETREGSARYRVISVRQEVLTTSDLEGQQWDDL
jgi:putative DNA primase/helicase